MKNRKLQSLAVLSGLLLTAGAVSAQFSTKGNPASRSSTTGTERLMKKAGPFNPDSTLFYSWNGNTNAFDSNSYSIFTYNGNTTVTVQKAVDGTIFGRNTQTNDANGNELTQFSEMYNQGNFVPSYKSESKYDARGNYVSHKSYTYNSNTSQYELNYADSTVNTYDGSNRLMLTTDLSFDNNTQQWANSSKTELHYTGTAQAPSMVIFYGWDDQAQVWEESEKADNIKWELGFTSIGEGEPTGYRQYEWDGSNWTPSTYDSSVITNNRRTASFSFDWDGTSIDPTDRAYYTYDAEGNQFTEIGESFDGTTWEQNYGSKDSTVYGSLGQPLLSYFSTANNAQGTWQFQSKRKNFFPSNLSVRETLLAGAVKIYPNPALNDFTIEKISEEVSGATIYSIQGKEMLHLSLVSGLNPVQTNGWKSGVYFIRLEGSHATSTQKIVVR